MEDLISQTQRLVLRLSDVGYTRDYHDEANEDIKAYCHNMSLLNRSHELFLKLSEIFSVQQTNQELQYKLLLAAIWAGKYSEAFMIGKDLLCYKSKNYYHIMIKLCTNHMRLPEYALHLSNIALDHYPNDSLLLYNKSIIHSILSDKSIYYLEKKSHLEISQTLLQENPSSNRRWALNLALVQAQLGNIQQAILTLAPFYTQFPDPEVFSCMSLLALAKEDYINSSKIISRGLQCYPSNFHLLYCKVIVKYELSKIRQNWNSCIKSTIKMLRCISIEVVEDSVSSTHERRVAGLASIREETSSVINERVDSIEMVKQLHFDKAQPYMSAGFGLAVKVFLDSMSFDMASWCSSFLEDTSYEKALLNLKKDNDTVLLESLVENAEAHEMLAIHEWEIQNVDKALVHCKYCLKLDGRRKTAWKLMGKIKFKLGNVDEGIECLKKAAENCNVPFHILPKHI